jgi:CheY-like chemotaxis protein
VSEAASCAEALSALEGRPAWILLDLMLPDGCGLEVLRSARAGGAGGDEDAPRCCVISGCASEMISQARQAGAEHTFTKPLDVERLMTVLGA